MVQFRLRSLISGAGRYGQFVRPLIERKSFAPGPEAASENG